MRLQVAPSSVELKSMSCVAATIALCAARTAMNGCLLGLRIIAHVKPLLWL